MIHELVMQHPVTAQEPLYFMDAHPFSFIHEALDSRLYHVNPTTSTASSQLSPPPTVPSDGLCLVSS